MFINNLMTNVKVMLQTQEVIQQTQGLGLKSCTSICSRSSAVGQSHVPQRAYAQGQVLQLKVMCHHVLIVKIMWSKSRTCALGQSCTSMSSRSWSFVLCQGHLHQVKVMYLHVLLLLLLGPHPLWLLVTQGWRKVNLQAGFISTLGS